MGRKTFESIGRPLPNRHNIVISRQIESIDNKISNVSWVKSIDEAIFLAQEQQPDEVFIIGGGNIYQQVLPLIDWLYLTHIDAELQGDTYFPDYLPEQWQVIYQQDHQADEKNSYPYQFQILQRK